MTSSATQRIRNQAVLWYTRLQSGDLSEQQRQEHHDWMALEPAHRDAFDHIQREYKALDQVDSWAKAELQQLEHKFAKQATISTTKKAGFSGLFGIKSIAASILSVIALGALFFTLSEPQSIYYETVKGEQRKIMLEDGSRVHLNSSSSISVSFSNHVRHIDLTRGEGLFDVAHERNRPFVVQVGDNKIVAVGTSFNVHANKKAADVTVVEGRVAIVPPGNQFDSLDLTRVASSGKTGLLLEKNYSAYVNENGEVETVTEVDAERLTAWDRGLIVFDQTPLRQVASELSRYVAGSITVAEGVPDYPVTGVIKISDQDTMLSLLSEVVPVIYVRQSATLTMLYPNAETKPN